MDVHPLDRPIWNALNTGWRHLAQGEGRALRLDPTYGPFAACVDDSPESLAALAALDPGETGLYMVETETFPAPSTMAAKPALCVQMVAEHALTEPPSFDYIPLAEADGAEMLALATLTRPGPFSICTHRFGGFIGVRRKGRLVAMAGTRIRVPGFAEVSGVCTHPDHRGQGYAGGLMREAMVRILECGETPFLHAYACNTDAIRLYESLGFTIRREIVLTVLTESSGPDSALGGL